MDTAVIDEQACVGCNRCVSACPVDAIVGAPNQLHGILQDACIGCKLCLPPCPMDCIEIVPLASCVPVTETIDKPRRAEQAKQHHRRRLQRLAAEAPRQLPQYASDTERKTHIRADLAAILQRQAEPT